MDIQGVRVSFDGEGMRLDTSEQAEKICQALTDKSVEVLVLQGNTFGIEAAERVGQELANQPCLREAHFKDLFTSRGKDEVPEALCGLMNGIMDSGAELTLLDLSDNAIGPIGAPTVVDFLNSPACLKLEKLYLNNCGLGPEGSTLIASTLSRFKNLREFVCGRNRLENKGATNMSRALSELNKLEILKLNQNGIQVDGIKKLVEILMSNLETIQEIDFSDNTIKAEGSDALAKALSRTKNLKIIRLDDALLENMGFSIICDSLSKSPSFSTLQYASFEGNELSGHKIVDLIEITFSDCQSDFKLDLLENEFKIDELKRLESLTQAYEIYLDEISSDDEYDDNEECDQNDDGCEIREEGECDDSGESNGYVDLSNVSDLREVTNDFIQATSSQPYDDDKVNSLFLQMLMIGARSHNDDINFQNVQIVCEEMGLIKLEETRKKKPLARDAVIYVGKRLNELPSCFRDFFQAVVKNNDDLSCGRLLFEKLEI